MRSKITMAILFLSGLSVFLTIRSAQSVGPIFQTECANYNGTNTITFIYPVGEKSSAQECVFVNPEDPSEFQCTDGAELGQISTCVTNPEMYALIPKLYAVVLGCNFDEECQKMGQHKLIYRNFTNVTTYPNTIMHDGDDTDFTHVHFPDLDTPRPKGIPANLWAIQAVFPCNQDGCGPQVRIEKMPTTLGEVLDMIDEGSLFAFPFPRHLPVLLDTDAQCPNMVLRIPIVRQACDPATHHVY